MKVTGYELYTIPPRWLFLKIKTDEGVEGWGEPVIEGRVETMKAAVSELIEDHLMGKDPIKIERHWQRMYHGGHHRGGPILMSAIAGVDHALWDLKGKIWQEPVYSLLGGAVRDRVHACRWITGEKPGEAAESATEAVRQGYSTLSMMMNLHPSKIQSSVAVTAAEDRLHEVRAAIGKEIDIAVDFRGRISRPVARHLLTIAEQYNAMYVEEPLLPEYNTFLENIVRQTTVPIATGQRLYSRWDFKEILESGAVDVIQPSICHAGGITEISKIASMSETYDIPVVSKCPVGPIAFAAAIHLCLATQNIVIQDQHHEMDDKESSFFEYIENPEFFTQNDGYISISDNSGLGINVDESAVQEKSTYDIRWRTPSWNHDDGSVADW